MNTLDTKNFNSSKEKYNKFQKKIFHSKSDISVTPSDLFKSKQIKINAQEIRKIFSQRLGVEVQKIEKINTESTFHILRQIEAGNMSFVLKIHALDKIFDEHSFYFEDYMQRLLKSRKAPHTKVVRIDLSKKDVPFEYMVMSRADGKNLEELFKETKGIEDRVYKQMGELFYKIHQIKTKNFGRFDVEILSQEKKLSGMHTTWKQFINLNLKNHLNECHKLRLMSDREVSLVIKLFKENSKLFDLSKPRLLHNDPSFKNIFAHRGNIVSILDWEDTISGDPEFELANIATFFFGFEREFKLFLEGYGKSLDELQNSEKYWLYFLRNAMVKEISNNQQGKKPRKLRIKFALDHIYS